MTNRSTEESSSAICSTQNSSANDKFMTQEQINQKFDKELKRVYSEIDKYSNLLWSAKDEFELFRSCGTRGTRSGTKTENQEESRKW